MTLATNERPIIFSGPMVKAILAGTKTQTRRVVRPTVRGCTVGTYSHSVRGVYECVNVGDDGDPIDAPPIRCPYGVPGDELWVRETWAFEAQWHPEWAAETGERPEIVYAADGDERDRAYQMRWRPSMLMPHWASRLTLVVRSVRVERLSAITDADAVAEGVRAVTKDGSVTKFCVYDRGDYSSVPWSDMPRTARECFIAGFRALNKLAPDADPWVWVVGFERTEPAR